VRVEAVPNHAARVKASRRRAILQGPRDGFSYGAVFDFTVDRERCSTRLTIVQHRPLRSSCLTGSPGHPRPQEMVYGVGPDTQSPAASGAPSTARVCGERRWPVHMAGEPVQACAEQKRRTWALNTSGCSMLPTCPAFGITINSTSDGRAQGWLSSCATRSSVGSRAKTWRVRLALGTDRPRVPTRAQTSTESPTATHPGRATLA
jgi:hypothetical protein